MSKESTLEYVEQLKELAETCESHVISVLVATPDKRALHYTNVIPNEQVDSILKDPTSELGAFYFEDARYKLATVLVEEEGDSNSERDETSSS